MMKPSNRTLQLLLVGAGPRLAVAVVISVLLFLGFFWATMPPGAS